MVKSSRKLIVPKGAKLETVVLNTMNLIAEIVGSTLGPGGRPVLIERGEGLPEMVTKDGVTVFKSLGLSDPIAHSIMNAARDAASRTASDAGDGPQPLWAKVLTPNGFVPMGKLNVNDEICGIDDTIQKVVGIYPKGKKEIFTVSFSGNRVVECSEDHLWTVTVDGGRTKTLTTRQMLTTFKTKQLDGYFKYTYYTPRVSVDYLNQTVDSVLPLDPYLVGLLLGDGSLSDSGSIELSLGKKKEHILNKIILPEGLFLKVTYSEKKHYRVKIQGKTPDGKTIRNFIEDIGLRNTDSYSKYIPQLYLHSSKQNRQALLQGLIDTDGHITKKNLFEFSTVSELLAMDVAYLSRSLGKALYCAKHIKKPGLGSYSTKPIYRVIQLKGYKYGDKIIDIKATGQLTDMMCIKVSNPDHLYITDGFVATHNTTSATILANAIVKRVNEYIKKNPSVSPQVAVRVLQQYFDVLLEPKIREWAVKPKNYEESKSFLHSVASISANGDKQIADTVMQAVELVGEKGNATIMELTGPSHYEVERIEGFPVAKGYEESCGRYHPLFINDQGSQRCFLEKPLFVLYDGNVSDVTTIIHCMEVLGRAFEAKQASGAVVLVAHGFSDSVLGTLATNFSHPETISVVPLLTPQNLIMNSRSQFLLDLQAFTGATVFNPLSKPLNNAELLDFGIEMDYFEAFRFKSTVVGNPDISLIETRAKEIQELLKNPESLYETSVLQERLGILTGGIAKIKIFGSSQGELREKRDRVEDAVCAVKGAATHGVLPGGSWTLLSLAQELYSVNWFGKKTFKKFDFDKHSIGKEILFPVLLEPFDVLLQNVGKNKSEVSKVLKNFYIHKQQNPFSVYDCMAMEYGDAFKIFLLDSVPAVLESLRNSLSIASLLGSLGGCVVFPRNEALEVSDYQDKKQFERDANSFDVNERI